MHVITRTAVVRAVLEHGRTSKQEYNDVGSLESWRAEWFLKLSYRRAERVFSQGRAVLWRGDAPAYYHWNSLL
jgi:hypothetical protein